MNPYQYCTRCGDELSDDLKEIYEEEHEGGPVLCRGCFVEIFQGIPKAMQPLFRELAEPVNELLKPLIEIVGNMEDDDE